VVLSSPKRRNNNIIAQLLAMRRREAREESDDALTLLARFLPSMLSAPFGGGILKSCVIEPTRVNNESCLVINPRARER